MKLYMCEGVGGVTCGRWLAGGRAGGRCRECNHALRQIKKNKPLSAREQALERLGMSAWGRPMSLYAIPARQDWRTRRGLEAQR